MLPDQICNILSQILGALASIPFIGGFFEQMLGLLDNLCGEDEDV